MQIELATDRDLDLVTDLRLAFIAEHRGVAVGSLEPTYVAATRAWVRDRSHAGRLASWLAREASDQPPVGIVSVVLADVPPRPDDPRVLEGYVINMWVAPLARRRGVARALLDACEEGATALGVRAAYLYATDDGRHLYDTAGYQGDPRWMRHALP